MTALATERAFAKLNLCLFLGPVRDDGRHELVTLFASVDLADELEIVPAASDEVVCPAVPGPNLVTAALAGLRELGWDAPPVRVTIAKRIPVAAGLGGGSADAAALLRCAPRLGAVPGELDRLAARLGADVPGQLAPGPSLGTGAGEIVQPLPRLPPYGVLILPQSFGLSTADVYREADRLGSPRPRAELEALRSRLLQALPRELPGELLATDLQPAALSLAPPIADALAAAADAGADRALVCGSGPTVIGIFAGAGGPGRADTASAQLRARFPGAVAASPVGGGVGTRTANEAVGH